MKTMAALACAVLLAGCLAPPPQADPAARARPTPFTAQGSAAVRAVSACADRCLGYTEAAPGSLVLPENEPNGTLVAVWTPESPATARLNVSLQAGARAIAFEEGDGRAEIPVPALHAGRYDVYVGFAGPLGLSAAQTVQWTYRAG